MNKVKNIKFRLTWKGNGCVNYNGSNVTKTLKKSGVDIPYHEVNGKKQKNQEYRWHMYLK